MFIEVPVMMEGNTPKRMTLSLHSIIGFRAMQKGDSKEGFDKNKSIILLSQTALLCSYSYDKLLRIMDGVSSIRKMKD